MARSSFLYILPLLPVLSLTIISNILTDSQGGPTNGRNERTGPDVCMDGWMDGWVFAFVRSCPQGEEEEEDELKL